MKIVAFVILAVLSWVITLTAYLFAPVIALFVDGDGNLPRWLRWYQTPDAPCWGAEFWVTDNPTYSRYRLIVTWLWRNPGQGFDQYANANINALSTYTVRGNLYIRDAAPRIGGWFLITCNGYFQLSIIWPVSFGCMVSHLGWNIEPLVKMYQHETMGALKATPMRFYINH